MAFGALVAGGLAGTAASLVPTSPALAWLEAGLLTLAALVAAFSYAGIARTRTLPTGVLVAGVIILAVGAALSVWVSAAAASIEERVVAVFHALRAAAWIACAFLSLRGFLRVRSPTRLLAPAGYLALALAAAIRAGDVAPSPASTGIGALGLALLCAAILLPRPKRRVTSP